MRKRYLQLKKVLSAALFVLLLSGTVVAQERYVVTATKLNVRKSASAESAIVGGLSKGDYVDVYSLKGGWAEIEFKKGRAFVSKKYIEKCDYGSTGKTSTEPASKTKKQNNDAEISQTNNHEKNDKQKVDWIMTAHVFANFTTHSSTFLVSDEIGVCFPNTRGLLPFDFGSCLFATAGLGFGWSSSSYSVSYMGYSSDFESGSALLLFPIRIGLQLGNMDKFNGSIQAGVVTNFLLTAWVNGDSVHMGFGDRFSWNASLRGTFGYRGLGILTELAIPFQSESKALLYFGFYFSFSVNR